MKPRLQSKVEETATEWAKARQRILDMRGPGFRNQDFMEAIEDVKRLENELAVAVNEMVGS